MKKQKENGIDLSGKSVTSDDMAKKVLDAKAFKRELDLKVKVLQRERDEVLAEFVAYRNTRPVAVQPSAAVRGGAVDKVRVTCADMHGMRMDKKAVAAFLSDVKRLNPDEVILLGDMMDCEGWLAQHHVLGFVANCDYTFQEDVLATNTFLDELQKAAPDAQVWYFLGNHECLHPDHEVLTKKGWKPISHVTCFDVVCGLGADGTAVWANPDDTVAWDFDGELFSHTGRGNTFKMTGNHRIMHCEKRVGKAGFRYRKAETFEKGSAVDVPVAGHTSEDRCNLSDDEVRLAAWLLTDGCVSAMVSFSQSKPETVNEIRDLLTRMCIPFSEHRRERKIGEICGKKLKSCLPSYDFNIKSSHAAYVAGLIGVSWTCHTRGVIRHIPEWVFDLSDERFGMFLATVFRANGSYVKSAGKYTGSIYGQKHILEELQAVCCTHGFRTSVKARTRNGEVSFWTLNVLQSDKIRVEWSNVERERYKGPVFCLKMPTENFVTRLNGCVHVTGNSRIERAIVDTVLGNQGDAAFLNTLWGIETVLRLNERGFTVIRRDQIYAEGFPRGWLQLGKMCFAHEAGGRGKNAARDVVSKAAANVTFGHTHREDTATIVFPGVGICKAFNPGCLSHMQPIYMHSDPTSWSQGYAIDYIAKSGEFQRVQVPIWKGQSLAGAMIERFKG